jgi:hypothetical protein
LPASMPAGAGVIEAHAEARATTTTPGTSRFMQALRGRIDKH